MGFAMPRKDNQNSNDLQEKDGKLALEFLENCK